MCPIGYCIPEISIFIVFVVVLRQEFEKQYIYNATLETTFNANVIQILSLSLSNKCII